LKEQTEELNASAMDFGQITGNIVKATGGMVAGFQAVKATMSIMGIENENIIASLKKMQDLMAITQALPSIDNGIKAFKRLGLAIKTATAASNNLKAALAASGIGLAIGAVGLLIGNWDKMKDTLQGVNREYDEMKKKHIDEYINKVSESLKQQISLEEKLTRARGGDDIDVAKAKVNAYAKEIENANKEIEDYTQLHDDWVKSRNEADARGDKNRVLRLNKVIEETNLTIEQYKAAKNTYELEKERAEAELRIAEAVKQATDAKKSADYKKALEMELEAAKAILGAEKSLEQELLEKFEGKKLKIPAKVELEAEDVDVSKADELRKKIENTIESLRGAFISPEEQYQQEINALELALNTKLIKEEEYLKLRDALNREQTQREINRYATAATSIGAIFSSLGELMEEGSEEAKALQIMGATINMLGGITAAISGAFTTHSGPWDIALAAIQAAAIAASGAATISQMTKTNKNNAMSTAHSSPNTSAINSIIAPVQYTKDVQGASIEGAIKDTRVYVVESDITNTQNKVRVSENEAVF
jgi:hypothetical protein